MSLLNELKEFLGSVKTSETISPALRSHISVTTGLEDALVGALAAGRDVIVAGSAGSGKTHLLESLRKRVGASLPPIVSWPDGVEPKKSFIRIIEDATALSPDRRRVMLDRPHYCKAVALAINEGPLLALAHELPGSVFVGIVRLLHNAQRGVSLQPDDKLPSLLDAGGYDPIQDGVVGQILALPILKELVDGLPCSCEAPEICPRRLAWKLLDAEQVRKRVNDLLQVVNLPGQAVLFREVWDFIADLALGGNCQDDPPTSTWFWRIFYGSNGLSKRLLQLIDPSFRVFPRAEAHIWYGDWDSSEVELQPGLHLVPLATAPPFRDTAYHWLKTQLFFLVPNESIMDVIRDQVDLRLMQALQAENTHEIIAAINTYMTYGTVPVEAGGLRLWIDMGVERRADRARGQVALGSVRTTNLSLTKSLIVVNHPDPACKIFGRRYFLVHRDGSSFHLSPEALNLLRGGRSYRSSDRPHTDMEWQITRFFYDLAKNHGPSDRLEILSLDFELMTAAPRAYRLLQEIGQLEFGDH